MNEVTQKQAERAAVAQRFQLEALQRALQSLDGELSVLESETVIQSDELSLLDELVAQLYAKAGLARPPEPAQPAIRTLADDDRPDHPRPYFRNVDRYIADQEVEVTGDPLAQLLPPHRAAEIQRQFHADFGRAAWDRWDYGAIALAVLVGALTDYLLVATPGGSFKGKPQRGSPLTAWMKEQSKKLAPISGPDDIARNALQQCIAKLTTVAEKWAKVPYDVVSPKLGLTPNVHRLASLGHDPLLGLVFGVGDVLSGTCTFIDKSGAWRVIDNPRFEGTVNPLEALVKVVVHGFSDVFTAQGLPPPLMASFHLISAKPGFTLREGRDAVSVRDVTRYMYANGYDLRHFMTTRISPAIAEVILSAYHGVRAFAAGQGPERACLPDKMKQEQMLALTHGLLASANVLKTALYGWNPMAINLAQFQILAKRMLSLTKLSAERDRLVQQRLDEGWKVLGADAELEFAPKGTS